MSLVLLALGLGSLAANADGPVPGWSGKEFKISPHDVIYIKVASHEELSGKFTVASNGVVAVPGVGAFKAATENARHLARAIAAALAPRLINPDVRVWIVWDNKVYIRGEVRNPGEYSLTPSMSVMDAIKQAGGRGDFAKRHARISVLRGSGVWYNYNEIVLQSGDVVFVP